MTAYELAEWQEFWRREPFGPRHEDYRTAIVAQMLYNANRDPDKSERIELDGFVPRYDDGKPKATSKTRLVDNFSKIPGVKIKRKKKR